MPHNVTLTLAYDGAHFYGWQKTEAGPSIEETLQTVLERLLQEPITLQATSRTDRGVHAEGQVVNFFTTKTPPTLHSINALLPNSLIVLELRLMPERFHPTLDVKKKLYTYTISNTPTQLPFHRHYAWHIPTPLDLFAMKRAASHLIGEQDFAAFCNVHPHQKPTNTTRSIESIEFTPLPQHQLKIEVVGNHFLYKMVRNLVGTLVYVGRGKLHAEEIPQILAWKARERNGGITAPAHGLTLTEIFFEEAEQ